MKPIALIFLLLLVIPLSCQAQEDLRPLLEAIRAVESSGNDLAIGDNGKSFGPYQCSRAAWIDACEYGKVKWLYDELVWSRYYSEQVFIFYTNRYGAKTWEERSRCWNSGPEWKEKYELTDKYWGKVKRELNRRAQ